eukprot:CAMPEP_0206146798 /NCGR_PEP_ID=MMETSP1473-20131121/31486_1 /ASSEMBLY_ACC=CAM_ASM_001109 /TAXON_ID=1461547 /ORGANISM="Stichococcus sp, Strain RCC1054" /LENGTH=546 /DNA_ID=CAMNT_0053543495 /DNA_START=176 /DNA_END=1817 /DNA_ORIENTATION=+
MSTSEEKNFVEHRRTLTPNIDPGTVEAQPIQQNAGIVVVADQRATEAAQTQVVRSHAVEAEPLEDADERLQLFLQWAVNNGVQGLDGDGSLVALCSDEVSGERGIAAVQDVEAGQVLVSVPMRLAITDHFDAGALQEAGLEGAPWNVRLACRLLQHVQQSPPSPWRPYLQVLPERVPSVDEAEVALTEYSPLLAILRARHQATQYWHDRLSPAASSDATLEQFSWAMSVVHSRTFGTAARDGGIGTRVMLPVVDLLNHGGSEHAGLAGSPPTSADSVRWDLAPPQQEGGEWYMNVSAIRDIEAGEEVLLSYGERHSDDFILSYGFCPVGNPFDDVLLFPSVPAALEWFFDRSEAGQRKISEADARQLYVAAVEAAQEATSESGQPSELRLRAGCVVDPRLTSAFAALAPGDVSINVALRCEELLAGCTPLLHDLAAVRQCQDADPADLRYFSQLATQMQQNVAELIGRGDFTSGTAAEGLPEEQTRWRNHIHRLAGQPPAESQAAGVPFKILTFRIQKKLLMWDVLFEIPKAKEKSTAAAEVSPVV